MRVADNPPLYVWRYGWQIRNSKHKIRNQLEPKQILNSEIKTPNPNHDYDCLEHGVFVLVCLNLISIFGFLILSSFFAPLLLPTLI